MRRLPVPVPVPVTVARFDAAALGRHAARRGYARIDGDAALASHEIVPCELVPIGSGEVPLA